LYIHYKNSKTTKMSKEEIDKYCQFLTQQVCFVVTSSLLFEHKAARAKLEKKKETYRQEHDSRPAYYPHGAMPNILQAEDVYFEHQAARAKLDKKKETYRQEHDSRPAHYPLGVVLNIPQAEVVHNGPQGPPNMAVSVPHGPHGQPNMAVSVPHETQGSSGVAVSVPHETQGSSGATTATVSGPSSVFLTNAHNVDLQMAENDEQV